MLTPSWSQKIISKKNLVYYLRHISDKKDSCYFFILVHPFKEKKFLEIIASGKSFDIKDYGDVIESGFGEEAPKQVIEWITNWYNQ